MNEDNLGRVLRLKATLDAASSVEPSGGAAVALTDSYLRLRAETLHLVNDAGLPADEFERLFRPIQMVRPPSADPWTAKAEEPQNESSAKLAGALLKQMAGWLDGVFQEQTLGRRLELEAKERVALEGKPPTGFGGS